jgi:hypothetical protein
MVDEEAIGEKKRRRKRRERRVMLLSMSGKCG